MINALTVDLEDWFCVYNFSSLISYKSWEDKNSRVEENTEKILKIFQDKKVNATFFILGWIADRFPSLVKSIDSEGHEIGSHTYSHMIIKENSREAFQKDLKLSVQALSKSTSQKIRGFRAPSFSIDPSKKWIFDVLKEENFEYDSSLFPVTFHPDYGGKDIPYNIHKIDKLTEFPMTVVKKFGKTFPCSGGGYFRLFPYFYTKWGFRQVNKEQRPAVFYFHPWEIDPLQPKVKEVSLIKKIRHYTNLRKTEYRLKKLLDDFKFDTMYNVIKTYDEV